VHESSIRLEDYRVDRVRDCGSQQASHSIMTIATGPTQSRIVVVAIE
jgi:hypothetical protein